MKRIKMKSRLTRFSAALALISLLASGIAIAEDPNHPASAGEY